MAYRIRSLDGPPIDLDVVDGRWAVAAPGERTDLSHLWAIPGLGDAHAHLSADTLDLRPADPEAVARRAYAYLEGGVFVCIDKGWSDDVVLRLTDRRPDRFPEIRAAGTMVATPGGYYADFGLEIDPADLGEVVGRLAADRPWVKLVGDWPRAGQGAVANFGEVQLGLAVDAAHAAGARVAIHTMAPHVPDMAVRAGIDSIEHGLFLSDDALAELAGRGGTWVPTVLRMEEVHAGLRPGSSGAALMAAGLDNVRRLLPAASEAGVRVLAGSDLAVPAGEVAREVVRLVEMGVPAGRAVEAGSTAVWEEAGVPAGFAPGLPADLVAFEDDPRHSPEVLCDPVVVVHRGRRLR